MPSLVCCPVSSIPLCISITESSIGFISASIISMNFCRVNPVLARACSSSSCDIPIPIVSFSDFTISSQPFLALAIVFLWRASISNSSRSIRSSTAWVTATACSASKNIFCEGEREKLESVSIRGMTVSFRYFIVWFLAFGIHDLPSTILPSSVNWYPPHMCWFIKWLLSVLLPSPGGIAGFTPGIAHLDCIWYTLPTCSPSTPYLWARGSLSST